MRKVFEHGDHTDHPWSDTQFKSELSEHLSMLYPAIAAQLGEWSTTEIIEDVAQTTWESAWQNRERFDPTVGAFHSWLVTIARRRAIDYVRTKIRQEKLQRKAELDASAVGRATPEIGRAHV